MSETTRTERIKASYHAVLRFLGRVDAREEYPEERLKEIYERAVEAQADDVDGTAYVDEETDTLLVVDRSAHEIVTCWQRGEHV